MTSWCVLWSGLFLSAAPPLPIEADVVLKGGIIHDGSGRPGQVGDIAIKGDRIVAVGAFTVARNDKHRPRVIDVRGKIVAPGFIDLHSHSDYPLQKKATRQNLSFLHQGVTTVITG